MHNRHMRKVLICITLTLLLCSAISGFALSSVIEYYDNSLPDDITQALADIVLQPYQLLSGYQVDREGGAVFLLLKIANEDRVFILNLVESAWRLRFISSAIPTVNGMEPHLFGNFISTFSIDYADFSSSSNQDSTYYSYTFEKQPNDHWMLTGYVYSRYTGGMSSDHVSVMASHYRMDMRQYTMLAGETIAQADASRYGAYDRDLCTVIIEDLPLSIEAMRFFLDASDIAMVLNTNTDARLFLRTRPDMDATSMGRYHNGVIVSVLERTNDEWTKVRIGDAVGYMLHKYLVYNEDIASIDVPQTQRFVHSIAENETLPLYQNPQSNAEVIIRLPYGTPLTWLGTIDDQWSHVLLDCGIAGYVKTAYLWADAEQEDSQ